MLECDAAYKELDFIINKITSLRGKLDSNVTRLSIAKSNLSKPALRKA